MHRTDARLCARRGLRPKPAEVRLGQATVPNTQALTLTMSAASANCIATILAVMVLHRFLNEKAHIVVVHLCARSGAKHDAFAPTFRSCWQQWSM